MDKEAIRIGRYIDGEMNVGELASFEASMACDPFLAEAVAGFKKDPGALYDFPIANGVKIQWWWSLVGVFAVAVVFMLIPQKDIDIPVFENPVNKEVIENLELDVNENIAIIEEDEIEEKISAKPILINEPVADEEVVELIAKTVYPKPAKLVIENELPELKIEENILFILDLKVVDNAQKEAEDSFYNLSDLTDFTPANFSTFTAFKRSEKYRGIFAEPLESTYLDQVETGLKYFKKGDYARAIRVFKLILKEDHLDVNALFYSALSEYEMGNYERALVGFTRVENLANQSFNQESEWYRALSLRKLGRIDESNSLMMKIANGDGHYSDRAKSY